MADFSKYSVSTSTRPRNLQQYHVGMEAPTLDDITQVSMMAQEPQEPTLGSKLKGRLDYAIKSQTAMQYGGQEKLGPLAAAGGAVGDIIGAVLNPFLTPVIEQAVSALPESVRETAGTAISSVSKTAQEFGKQYPGIAQFGADAFNASNLIPAGAVGKEGVAITRDSLGVASKVLRPSESAVQNKVIQMFNKAVKPTAKKTSAMADRYNNDVVTAVQRIKQEAPSLNIEDATGEIVSRAPQSLNELEQALQQTQQSVFKEYDALAKKAGDTGAVLKTENIAKELDAVAGNIALKVKSPEIIKYAENWATRLRETGAVDTETAQEIIKMMNADLKAFYNNPTYEAASKAAIDAGIANNFRKELDNLITSATGENYQQLKRVYGSLAAIEKDVVRASMRDARKNVKGLLDYTDMLTSGQIVSGILSLNPAMTAKGAIERGFKEYIKYLNDPNRIIKGMFDALDKPFSFTPTSNTFKAGQQIVNDLKGNKQGFADFNAPIGGSQEFQRRQSMTSNTTNTTKSSMSGISSKPTTKPSNVEGLAKDFLKAEPPFGLVEDLKKFADYHDLGVIPEPGMSKLKYEKLIRDQIAKTAPSIDPYSMSNRQIADFADAVAKEANVPARARDAVGKFASEDALLTEARNVFPKELQSKIDDAKYYFANEKPFKTSKPLWRGQGVDGGTGGADFGKGLYFSTNKKLAGQYGQIREISSDNLPKNPLRFDSSTKYEGFLATLKKALGKKSEADFNYDYGELIRALGDYDGVVVGDGAIIVKYPEGARRMSNEQLLKLWKEATR